MKGTIRLAWGMALGLVLGTTAIRLEAADSAAVRPVPVQNAAPAEPKAAVADSKSAEAKAKARLSKIGAEYKARRKANAQRREARLVEVRKEAKERAEARERAKNPPEVKVFVSNELSPSEKNRPSQSE